MKKKQQEEQHDNALLNLLSGLGAIPPHGNPSLNLKGNFKRWVELLDIKTSEQAELVQQFHNHKYHEVAIALEEVDFYDAAKKESYLELQRNTVAKELITFIKGIKEEEKPADETKFKGFVDRLHVVGDDRKNILNMFFEKNYEDLLERLEEFTAVAAN